MACVRPKPWECCGVRNNLEKLIPKTISCPKNEITNKTIRRYVVSLPIVEFTSNMKTLYRVLVLLAISLSVFSGCVTLRPATVDRKKDLSMFSRVYIPPTQTIHGSTAIVVSGMVLPYSQSVNPRDVIAGMLSKKGYIILNELDDRFRHETVIVNYGESNRRNLGLGGYTIEVTLQFISASTGELVCTTTAEGCGSTEAADVKQAVTRALKALFK